MGTSFLSWNLAVYERSAEAPQAWAVHDTEAYVRSVVLSLDPDVVVFQELPGQVPFIETHDMIRANPHSHSGNLATLVRHDLLDPAPRFSVVDRCAVLTTLASKQLTIANVHMSPGPGEELTRRYQMASIVQSCPTDDLLVVGDTNTRVEEAAELAAEFGLTAVKPPKATWDSKVNRFWPEGRLFTAYFTRCFTTENLAIEKLRVHREPVDHGGKKFFISDHFALSGTVSDRGIPSGNDRCERQAVTQPFGSGETE